MESNSFNIAAVLKLLQKAYHFSGRVVITKDDKAAAVFFGRVLERYAC